MKLTKNEIISVQSALETISENKNAMVAGNNFREPLRSQLINSSLKKLEKFDDLSDYSPKELTIMSFAVQYILNISEFFPISKSEEGLLFSAQTKLLDETEN